MRLKLLLPLLAAFALAGTARAQVPDAAPASAAASAPTEAPGPKVDLETSMGKIVIELDPARAPRTVANFLRYVRAGHYNGVIFHRVIDGFMIQTGGYRLDRSEKPTRPPIPLESRNGLSNVRGSVAMARTAIPDSATSQFFINVADNLGLDQAHAPDGEGYAVFGRVVQGMDVVDRIKAVPTHAVGVFQNLPVHPVTINKAIVER
ncbi:MAG: peptidyl-prolyl cis-trans isomerase [Betaproteobacteria bacterium]|nr:peptidyl-prolyl cis-trans isomerase [Burkholderiales bacterium]MDE1928360.1 peptidyl-prolyl cis-trans isomerase [Burkholderiales bacterium]MDE2120772.1 peptidyl-prolyl cis-trans isomerase [Betaproteobacteria bacterium]MDE2502962.1 peptidyl-prolyl cis-trans isomerase [Burkholderiales bacterium]